MRHGIRGFHCGLNALVKFKHGYRTDSRLAPSQWETALLCNDVSHWLDASLESALRIYLNMHVERNKWTAEAWGPQSISTNIIQDQCLREKKGMALSSKQVIIWWLSPHINMGPVMWSCDASSDASLNEPLNKISVIWGAYVTSR